MRRAALLLALLAAAGPGVAPPAAAQAAARVAPDYRLGADDLVAVEVDEAPSLSVETRLSADGTLELPVLGEVRAGGATAAELAREIERRLEESYLERATVTVRVVEVRARTLTVMGAVASPGSFGYPGDWTLLQALAAAGGLAADHGSEIRVLRRSANGLSDQLTLSIDELTVEADPDLNVPVFPDDLITVERRRPITVYLLGESGQTGAVELASADGATLLTVIARAGGLSERASPRIRIKRRGADGQMIEIQAHYGRILDGTDPDVELADGDLILIKESFF